MENKKPLGIILIAIYTAFSGILSLLVGTGLLFVSVVPDISVWMPVLGMVILAIGVFCLAATYGLWSIQPWGRNFTKWLYIIFIPIGVISIFPIYPDSEMTTTNTVMQSIGIIIDLIFVWYLSKQSVCEFFNRHQLAG